MPQQNPLLDHITSRDASILQAERAWRSIYGGAESVTAEQQSELLLDVFSPDTLQTFAYAVEHSSYTHLFSHLKHPMHLHAASTRAVTDSIRQFKQSFTHMSGGVFEGLSVEDWNNMIVAGGSVTACLMRPPDDVASADINKPEGKDKWTEWLGPNSVQPYMRGVPFKDRLMIAESGFGDSDVDIFFYDLTPEAADNKLNRLMQHFNSKRAVEHGPCLEIRSPRAVTLLVDTQPGEQEVAPVVSVQVVLRLYNSPAAVLTDFDIDSCCVAYNGSRIVALPRARRAFTERQNLVDPSRWSPSYEKRLMKYARRGFRISIPGLRSRQDINPMIFYHEKDDGLQGLSVLLVKESGSMRQKWCAPQDQLLRLVQRHSPGNHTFMRVAWYGKQLEAIWVTEHHVGDSRRRQSCNTVQQWHSSEVSDADFYEDSQECYSDTAGSASEDAYCWEGSEFTVPSQYTASDDAGDDCYASCNGVASADYDDCTCELPHAQQPPEEDTNSQASGATTLVYRGDTDQHSVLQGLEAIGERQQTEHQPTADSSTEEEDSGISFGGSRSEQCAAAAAVVHPTAVYVRGRCSPEFVQEAYDPATTRIVGHWGASNFHAGMEYHAWMEQALRK